MKRVRHRIPIRLSLHIFAVALVILMPGFTIADARMQDAPSTQIVAPEKIRLAVKKHILRRAPWDPDQMTIDRIRFNQAISVPAGKVALRVIAPRHTDWIGAVAFTVNLMVDGRKVGRLTVPAYLDVWSDVIVTTRPLGKYEPIGQNDIRIEKMNLARISSNVIDSIDGVLGRRTKRNIAANCILRKDLVEIQPIVKRGQMVRVLAESPILKISVKGIAKQNGAKGDRIKVINIRSKKAVYARVVDGQTVQVDF
ncbi:MAG: flagellar basal body P-ring formation chaperone FlgA [Desulfobacteraceae bacterium]|jgi:flagella basal body P-ring formation protein FlgA